MTRDELILKIKSELKNSTALPYSIPDTEINRIIDETKKWFYENYEDAVENKSFIIPSRVFKSKEFLSSGRKIKLPKCVISVIEVREFKGGNKMIGYGNLDDMIMSDIYTQELGVGNITGNVSDRMVYMVVVESFWDLSRAFMLDVVRYNFNKNTKNFQILGRQDLGNLYLNTYIEIPENDLFDDYYFVRYVTSKVKMQLGNILGFFEYKLPGGVTINSDNLYDQAKDEIDNIEKKIDSDNTPDWFYTF